ncbi:substrate-binding periplasmic protein [Falsiroseomonas tokyonensis]|uniref:Substrate-binding periplasmic protein n=1 Tax=Falsiroseomonas tokyonensis TaxID=430521 RepID=A0ABV7BQ42_9PROT|nr:transporter substrate-binding domain-containing protein [Falsiroseomonas tokyonensis]MBU8536250.1 transporter substrate-binding domain-containing protein [Falsiroseomonas tokyonensis]
MAPALKRRGLAALASGLALPLLALPRLARADAPLEVIASDIRPLSFPGTDPSTPGRRGITLDILAEAIRAIGRSPRFTFLSFGDAVDRARSVPGTLICPLGRTPAREAQFTWVAKVVEVPQAMGTLPGKPVLDLEGARAVPRIGVVRNGLQEVFLRQNGLDNLLVLETGRDLALALAEGRIAAWYATEPEIHQQFNAIGRPGGVRTGPALQSIAAWLAAHPDPRDQPIAALRGAMARLEADGTVARIYRSYASG